MKDTFKTFPCGQTSLCRRNDKGERIYCHKCTKPEEWKQRIEKELREMLEDRRLHLKLPIYGPKGMITEILGET